MPDDRMIKKWPPEQPIAYILQPAGGVYVNCNDPKCSHFSPDVPDESKMGRFLSEAELIFRRSQ